MMMMPDANAMAHHVRARMSHVPQNRANANADRALHFSDRLRVNAVPDRANELLGDIVAVGERFCPYKAD